jgi:hypothetical protein
MRDVIIIWFIITCIIMLFAVVFIWRYLSLRNKKIVKDFVTNNNTIELGVFTCTTDKKFLSPSNQNYVFNSFTIYKVENGFLICPTTDQIFKITLHLKPFILSNQFGEYKNIDVYSIEGLRKMENECTYIKLKAKYNAIIELQIDDAEGILREQFVNYFNSKTKK